MLYRGKSVANEYKHGRVFRYSVTLYLETIEYSIRVAFTRFNGSLHLVMLVHGEPLFLRNWPRKCRSRESREGEDP
jgi:hypothetical protein